MSDLSDTVKYTNAIDAQARASLLRPDSRLDEAVSNSKKQGLRPIAISPLQGQFLAIQCQLIDAKHVLEIGTLGGYSTIFFANTGAKVTSLEIDAHHRDVAVENTEGMDVDVRLGPALDILPKLAEEGLKFDLVFIDADWEQQAEYFDWAVKLTRKKGCIYVDNVVRELIESQNLDVDSKSLVTSAGKNDKVTATLIQTVSSHKQVSSEMFDGFLFAMVK